MCRGSCTSAAAACSRAGISAGVTFNTRGATVSPAAGASVLSVISDLATRSPSPAPVASRIVMWRTEFDAPLREATYIGKSVAAAIRTGTSRVTATNQRERTRSMYSRLVTMNIFLSMAGHPRFDATRADALQEDFMERRLHQLEPLDVGAGIDQPAEQELRVGARRQLDLEKVRVVVEPVDERPVAEDGAHAVLRAAGESKRDVPRARRASH